MAARPDGITGGGNDAVHPRAANRFVLRGVRYACGRGCPGAARGWSSPRCAPRPVTAAQCRRTEARRPSGVSLPASPSAVPPGERRGRRPPAT